MAPVRRRIRRGKRRKCKQSSDDNTWSLYHLNIRGYKSKKESFSAIIGNLQPNLITLNETCLKSKQKIKLTNYKSFNRNRCTGQIMGGISTSVRNDEKDYVVKTTEGNKADEFLITRHANFLKPINVINIYGETESRVKESEVESRWMRIYNEILKIENRQEDCIIIGDMNKHIGCDDLGVQNNHPRISFGGELIRSLLAEGKYICLNNHTNTTGGPYTRVDPADPLKLSCLDLVLVSRSLLPYFSSMIIDSVRKYSPVRPVSKNVFRHPDHYPIIVKFENIPRRPQTKPSRNAHTVWNTNKVGGWESYRVSTDCMEEFTNIFYDDKKSTTENVQSINTKLNKKKFFAFGKVKHKSKPENKELQKLYEVKSSKLDAKVCVNDIDDAINDKLLEIQKKNIEKEIEDVMVKKKSKGNSAAIFQTLNKICGNKKSNQEQVCMLNPKTNLQIFEPKEIKTVSLQYCVDLLTKRNVYEEFKDNYYLQDMIHLVRCEEDVVEEYPELNIEEFEKRFEVLKSKCKDKYQFILKSGNGYKKCIFDLFSKIWRVEEKPEQWRNTVIVQLYKGRGEESCFDNQRNIHTKEADPKFFEGIVVDLSKPKLTKRCSKFQIGGIQGHRPQEHLFTLKSIIGLYMYLNIPLLLQLWDISKYFDKEVLRDAMDTLYEAGIKGKLYRLWHMLNKDAQIRVKTSFGLTEVAATGENVAQGSIGGAIASSLNLDKTIGKYFAGSEEVSYLSLKMAPVMYQDDTARFATSIEDAQMGNYLISKAMKLKQLDLNVDKCGTIIFGKNKQVQQLKQTIEEGKRLTIDGSEVKVKLEDKYLGDYLHSGGLGKSAETTINKRFGVCLNEVLELKSVLEDFRMHSLGGIKAGMEIFNLTILPKLIYNSDTWVELNDKSIKRLENLQNIFLRCLLSVPISTPAAALNWDSGFLAVEYRVSKKKLMLIHHLVNMDNDALASEVFQIQREHSLPGLVHEGRELCELFCLPNIIDDKISLTKQQWKQKVNKAVNSKYDEILKTKISDYSKLKNGPMMDEKFEEKPYLTEMSMHEARTNFRIRSNMTDVKWNKRSDKNNQKTLWKCEECGNVDSQSHIIWCPFFASLREGKSLDSDQDLVKYFIEVFKIRKERQNDES